MVSYRGDSHPWVMVIPQEMWDEWTSDSEVIDDPTSTGSAP